MGKYKFYFGGEEYRKLKLGDDSSDFIIEERVDKDYLANNFINNATMSIAQNGSDLNVTFTPCTNQELLDAVDHGDTKVRIQLLVHKVSATSRTWNPLVLENGFYWENSTLTHGANRWARVASCGTNAKGHAWLDLTSEQLKAGSATLTNFDGEGISKSGETWIHTKSHMNLLNAIPEDELIRHVSCMMYCPALYRSHKDMWYYDREDEIRCISSNYLSLQPL